MTRMNYEQTMAWGAAQYADVLQALADVGLRGEFIQTGGMCAALEVRLEGGQYLLITDLEDTLAWSRAEHEGWYVGLYEADDRNTTDGPLRWVTNPDGSTARAVELAQQILRDEIAARIRYGS